MCVCSPPGSPPCELECDMLWTQLLPCWWQQHPKWQSNEVKRTWVNEWHCGAEHLCQARAVKCYPRKTLLPWLSHNILGSLRYGLAFIALTNTFGAGGKAQEGEVTMFITQISVISAIPYLSHGLNNQVLTAQILEVFWTYSCFFALSAISLADLLVDYYYNSFLMGELP